MPCYDSRVDEERVRTAARASNLTALLCGLARGESAASIALVEFYRYHKLVDAANAAEKRIPHSPVAYLAYQDARERRESAQLSCDAILEAYIAQQQK